MMDNFPERVKKVAEMVGNASELSRLAGINRRTIGTYLSGKSEPTRTNLVAMAAAAGVNLTWLATGQGPIAVQSQLELDAWRARALEAEAELRTAKVRSRVGSSDQTLASSRSLARYREQFEEDLGQSLGLEAIAMLARLGAREGAWEVAVVLSGTYPAGLPIEEIYHQVQLIEPDVSVVDVAVDLELLVEYGLVEERAGPDGNDTYALTSSSVSIASEGRPDIHQHVQLAIRSIIREVLPAVERRDDTGKVLTARMNVPSGRGRAVKQKMLQAVREAATAEASGTGPETVTMVLAVAVEEA